MKKKSLHGVRTLKYAFYGTVTGGWEPQQLGLQIRAVTTPKECLTGLVLFL